MSNNKIAVRHAMAVIHDDYARAQNKLEMSIVDLQVLQARWSFSRASATLDDIVLEWMGGDTNYYGDLIFYLIKLTLIVLDYPSLRYDELSLEDCLGLTGPTKAATVAARLSDKLGGFDGAEAARALTEVWAIRLDDQTPAAVPLTAYQLVIRELGDLVLGGDKTAEAMLAALSGAFQEIIGELCSVGDDIGYWPSVFPSDLMAIFARRQAG